MNFRNKKCVFIGYSSSQKGYHCLDFQTNRIYISRHVLFDETQFPAKDSLASPGAAVDPPPGYALPAPSGISSPPDLSPLLSVDHTSHSFNSSSAQDVHSSPASPIPPNLSPASPIPPNISAASPHPPSLFADSLDSTASPIPSADNSTAPIPQHPSRMITRSQTHSSTPKLFPDYHLYSSTKYPFHALTSVILPAEPTTYNQAVKNPCWLDAMRAEYNALLSNKTWSLCPRPSHKKVVRNK